MVYRTSKCPTCSKVVEQFAGYDDDLNLHIGSPVAQCNHCGTQYQTGRKFWKDMTKSEKGKIYSLLILGFLVGGLKVALIVMLAVGGTCALLVKYGGFTWPEPRPSESDPLIFALCLLSLVGGYAYAIRNVVRTFRAFKQLG